MTEPIAPALSDSEWKALYVSTDGPDESPPVYFDDWPIPQWDEFTAHVVQPGTLFLTSQNDHVEIATVTTRLPALIALANAALPYSDDRKFRHHWVSWLREEADILQRGGAGAGAMMARQIADTLASYLPPLDPLPPDTE